ncbi:MAG: glycosyltransferase family 4 protein [Candidatus Levybacteria bacterium]|nr:glycosyltransferase family 4 protein [Candidatus Levybacteria bacterium]
MKILIVSSFLPYPLFSGGHVRLFNLIKELATKHELTIVCEKRSHQTDADIMAVKRYCQTLITVERKKQWSFPNVFRTGFSPFPFLLVGHTNDEMRRAIIRLINEKSFDLIHVETFYVMQNIPDTPLPVVLVEHNIEYLVYKRYTKMAPFLFRPLLYFDVAKLKYWEEIYWSKATKLVAVSEEEKKLMNREDVEVVSNGVDIQKFRIQNSEFRINKKEKRILFIGDFKWLQNRDAVGWILNEIWPEIKSKIEAKLWIVGKDIPDSIKKLSSDQNVIFDENAPKETAEIFAKADVLLAPIRVGGGTSYKILEAMASGVPVITTPLGREGIDAKDRQEILLAEDTDEFVKNIVDIFDNEKLYKKIAHNSRKLIEEKYDWKIIVKKLEDVYRDAITTYD